MKKIKTLLFLHLVVSQLFAQDSTSIYREYIENGLKNYAFCRCLHYANKDNIKNIDSIVYKDGSIGAYFNTIDIPFEYFYELDTLAIEFSKKTYLSKYDANLTAMKCLDFYNNKELNKKINLIIDNCEDDWNGEGKEHFWNLVLLWKKRLEEK